MDPSPFTDFNVKLRCLRHHCGFSQSDLAEFMQITQPAYHKMECRHEPPRTKRLQQIAQFYNLRLSDFLDLPVEELLQQVELEREFRDGQK